MGFIYVIILLAEKSIWERFYVCKFLVGDAKEFYTIVASGWDTHIPRDLVQPSSPLGRVCSLPKMQVHGDLLGWPGSH